MISHALTIVSNEFRHHLEDAYGVPFTSEEAGTGNLSEGLAAGGNTTGVPRNRLIFTLVNSREEKSLKNLPAYVRNDATLKATYENPPVFLNFLVLVTATHTDYNNALIVLSRAIRFFQSRNVFTHENVLPVSINTNAPANVLDRLAEFKLIWDFYSPTMEEINHMWGTLGGKQYPFVLYMMRMLDLKFRASFGERGLITEIVSSVGHK